MMKSSIKAPRILPAVLAAMLCLWQPVSASAAAEQNSDLHVVTTIPPLYALTAKVMEGVGEPELLMNQGDSPHHFTMKPHDAQILMAADMVICTSKTYENYLEPLLSALPERHRPLIEALNTPGLSLIDVRETPMKNMFNKHFTDMHFWLDPVNAKAYVAYIAEELAGVDPANAGRYADNAKRHIHALNELHNELQKRFANPPYQAQYANYHASLGYFERRYGVTDGAVITRTPESGASVHEAQKLEAAIADGRIRCLFNEPEFSPRLIERMKEKFADDVQVITVDALGATYEVSPALYEQMILDVATAVAACTASTPQEQPHDAS
jgi:zinc transport system substrate-binding protein